MPVPVVYALLVGVDRYRAEGVSALGGCRNDITAAAAFLRSRTAATVHLLELCDGEATRAAVVDGLHNHLGQAGRGDTALFWFSGHGAEAPVPAALRHLESGAMLQTLVCADSRTDGVPDLLDKELSLLLDEIAEHGAHIAVVLDSCHSAGATRDPSWVRAAPPGDAPPVLLPELGGRPAGRVGAAEAGHVALAAARRFEAAHERRLGGERRGLFSWALLGALNRLGGRATYRELLTAARAEVEIRAIGQVPQLYPDVAGPIDVPFLGGAAVPPGSGMVLRYGRRGWELDAGRCHGLPDPVGGELRVAEAGAKPAREARVVEVLTECSLIEPVDGWPADRTRQYPVVISRIPVPATTVAVDGDRRLASALATSPFVRLADPRVPADLRVIASAGTFRITDDDNEPICEPVDTLDVLVPRLEHVARWRQIHALDNPQSRLGGRVTVEIVAAPVGRAAEETDPSLPVTGGAVRLRYAGTTGTWTPPRIRIRLRNHHDRRLFCVLLDLTGAYRVHARLFPGDFVDPGAVAWAREGRPVQVSLPGNAAPAPGRQGKDWLKLLVAEEQFGSAPFDLAALDQAGRSTRAPMALHGLIARLGREIVDRDVEDAGDDGGYDWTALTLPIVTEVPRGRSRSDSPVDERRREVA
jgi:hypothetical protein